MSEPCPCGSGDTLDRCCGPVIHGRSARTAEQLMRSRYTAFVQRNASYLLDTWHPGSCPGRLDFDPEQRWLGLRIKRSDAGQPGDESGVVEFVARYKIAGRGYRLHEVSRFSFVEGRWMYVDGDFPGTQ